MGEIMCPNCSNKMEKVTYEISGEYIVIYSGEDELEKIYKSYTTAPKDERIEIDRCTKCDGIWFDKGEYEKLSEMENGVGIESEKSKSDDEIIGENVEKKCPHCDVKLTEELMENKSIRFEKCETCEGIFLDGGEFAEAASATDVKKAENKGIIGFFEKLFVK